MSLPLVSVCMITYNHEMFIAEAIEGVLMQEVDFEVELIIADDCSFDRTQEIVKGYIDNHPKGNWITYTRHDQNKGMMANFIWAVNQCKGDYIALCEGDDFWTDPYKLKKQVDFLENNPDFSIVSHLAKKIRDDEENFTIIGKLKKDIYEIHESQSRFYALPTASLVFRNIESYPDWIYKVYGGDRALIYICTQLGNLKVMDFVGSIYRKHNGGVEYFFDINLEKRYYRNINEYLIYVKFVDNKFKLILYKMITLNFLNLSKHFFSLKKYQKSFQSILLSFKYYFFYLLNKV